MFEKSEKLTAEQARNFIENVEHLRLKKWMSRKYIAEQIYRMDKSRFAIPQVISQKLKTGIPDIGFVRDTANVLKCLPEELLASPPRNRLSNGTRDFIKEAIKRQFYRFDEIANRTNISLDKLNEVIHGSGKFNQQEIKSLRSVRFSMPTLAPFAHNDVDLMELTKSHFNTLSHEEHKWYYQRVAINRLKGPMSSETLSQKAGISYELFKEKIKVRDWRFGFDFVQSNLHRPPENEWNKILHVLGASEMTQSQLVLMGKYSLNRKQMNELIQCENILRHYSQNIPQTEIKKITATKLYDFYITLKQEWANTKFGPMTRDAIENIIAKVGSKKFLLVTSTLLTAAVKSVPVMATEIAGEELKNYCDNNAGLALQQNRVAEHFVNRLSSHLIKFILLLPKGISGALSTPLVKDGQNLESLLDWPDRIIGNFIGAEGYSQSIVDDWRDLASAILPELNTIGWSAVDFAIKNNCLDSVRFLMTQGLQSNLVLPTGGTLAHYLAQHRQPEILSYFIDYGIALTIKDANGNTPLYLAAMNGDIKTIQTILEKATDKNLLVDYNNPLTSLFLSKLDLLNLANDAMATPLHAAAATNHVATMKYLLDQGANLETISALGWNAVDYAIKNNCIDSAQSLTNQGLQSNLAKELVGKWEIQLNSTLDYSVEPAQLLLNTAKNGDCNGILLAIHLGADINTIDAASPHKMTPLHYAAHGHREAMELLIKKGADVNSRDAYGRSARCIARELISKREVQFNRVHDYFVECDKRLLAAAHRGDCNGISAAIHEGADVNAIDQVSPYRMTALHYAAHGYPQAMDLLMKMGASVNARDSFNRTPLHIARECIPGFQSDTQEPPNRKERRRQRKKEDAANNLFVFPPMVTNDSFVQSNRSRQLLDDLIREQGDRRRQAEQSMIQQRERSENFAGEQRQISERQDRSINQLAHRMYGNACPNGYRLGMFNNSGLDCINVREPARAVGCGANPDIVDVAPGLYCRPSGTNACYSLYENSSQWAGAQNGCK